MLLAEGGKVKQLIPTAAREVFDVSGAGDTVIASLTLALVAGHSFVRSARFANLAAGVVVGKVGTASVLPEEIISLSL
jgi:bifunctional ADP-heptose synthase (sugar kinase/adenylyltransferase)